MKKIFTIQFTVLLTSVFALNLPEPPWDKLSMGVRNNSGYNTTFSKINYLYGLEFLHLDLGLQSTIENCDFNGYGYYEDCEEEEIDGSVSAFILVPRFGKQFNLKTSNRIQTYYKGEAFMILPFVSLDFGEESSTEFEKDIQDVLDMLGFNIAYGVEYKFNEQLSFSTNFGANYLMNDFKIDETKMSAILGHSYTNLSLNFYVE